MGIERIHEHMEAAQANIDAEAPAMMGVMDATDEASAYGVEGERVEYDDSSHLWGVMKPVIDSVVDSGEIGMITKRGRMVAMIIPMTVSELVRRKFESDPELKAQIDAALAEGRENSVPASELFSKTGELEEQ